MIDRSPSTSAANISRVSSSSSIVDSIKTEENTKSGWRNTGIILVFEFFLLVAAVIFVSPSYETPSCSNHSFFHTVNQGEPVSFQLQVSGWPEPSFQWRLNGVDITGATDKRFRIDQVQYSDSGTYTCFIENMAGSLVWEEGYVNVLDTTTSGSINSDADRTTGRDESKRLAEARACLLARAPEPVRKSASFDGGAAVIAAGETAGYLDCFEGLKLVPRNEAKQVKQMRALDLLRSLHGSSHQRDVLVNVVTALDDLALAKRSGHTDNVEDLSARVAFEAGVYCASTPQCAGDKSGVAKTRVVTLIMNALTGSSPDSLL